MFPSPPNTYCRNCYVIHAVQLHLFPTSRSSAPPLCGRDKSHTVVKSYLLFSPAVRAGRSSISISHTIAALSACKSFAGLTLSALNSAIKPPTSLLFSSCSNAFCTNPCNPLTFSAATLVQFNSVTGSTASPPYFAIWHTSPCLFMLTTTLPSATASSARSASSRIVGGASGSVEEEE